MYFDASDNIEAVLFNSIVFYNGGVTSYSVRASEENLGGMGIAHEFPDNSNEFQMNFYGAMKDLYERKILQNS